jgi:hypothetical protein
MGPFTFQWSDGITGTSYRANLCSGVYEVSVADANGCERIKVDTINNLLTISTSDITGDTLVSKSSITSYSVINTTGHNYDWFTKNGPVISGQGSAQVSVQWFNLGAGYVKVLESNSSGCIGDTISMDVEVYDPATGGTGSTGTTGGSGSTGATGATGGSGSTGSTGSSGGTGVTGGSGSTGSTGSSGGTGVTGGSGSTGSTGSSGGTGVTGGSGSTGSTGTSGGSGNTGFTFIEERERTLLEVYPNPFSEALTIMIPKASSNNSLSIYDLLGKRIKNIKNIITEIVYVDDWNVQPGIYFIEFKTEDQTYKRKVMLSK